MVVVVITTIVIGVLTVRQALCKMFYLHNPINCKGTL